MKARMFATFVLGLALVVPAGDILEIRLSNEQGEALLNEKGFENAPVSSVEYPFYSGEDIYFKIRLVSREDNQKDEALSARSSFLLVHNPKSPQDETTDWQEHPLEIGIVVSGETRWARLTRLQRASANPETGLLTRNCFDAVFTYQAEPGDLALPLLLARDEDGHAVDDDNRGYVFRNTNVWSICYCSRGGGMTNAVDFSFSADPTRGGTIAIDDRYEQRDCLTSNYSLRKSGFYVQAVDFADEWEAEPITNNVHFFAGLWKSVGEGKTRDCRLEATAPVPQDRRYFVWSDNSLFAQVKDGVATVFTLNKIRTATVIATNYIGEVVIPKGETLSKPFTLQGEMAGDANLILSCAKSFSYDSLGERYTDYLTVPISCVVREAIPVQVEAVAHTQTSLVVPELEELAEGCVWSNCAAQVVYVCESGYRFPDGSTVVTNDLDTTVSPAKLRAGVIVPTCGQPSVCLGAVTQRYPWNTFVDIEYMTPYAHAGDTVTFTAAGQVLGTAKGTGGAVATVSFDLAAVAAFQDTRLEGVTIAADLPFAAPTDASQGRWAATREIAVDTRTRRIILTPEEVLPIAYSTNFWAATMASRMGQAVSVSVTDPSGVQSNIVSKTKSNGFSEWKPSEGAFGRYSLKHSTLGASTHKVGAEIYYSKYSQLTVTPAEGGAVVAITNGVAATGAFDVLGYESVDLKATPADETWQFVGWSVVTNGGAVTGSGTLASARATRTLSASPKNGSVFAGWYRAKADDANTIDLDNPATNLVVNVKRPQQIKVGFADAGTYFAYFTNVLEVAAVVEPVPFDDTGKACAGVAGLTGWDGNGVYSTMVGVKFALPVAFSDASGKGRLVCSKLPSGLAYNAKKGCIEGVPTKSGTYASTFVASNAAGKQTITYTFEVAEMPAVAVGTFAGVVRDDDLRAGVGSVTFTAGKTGSLSAKVVRRLSGPRTFSVKGYDYIDADTLGIAMTNNYGEVFAATLALTNGWYDTAIVGTAFGGTKKGTLGGNGETNGVFAAVRNAFSNADKDPAAQQILAAFKCKYEATLCATNGFGVVEGEVGSVLYRVNAQGSVYVVARLAKTADGARAVSAKTFSGSVLGGFVYNDATGVGRVAVALRSGTSIWSSDVDLDYGTLDAAGLARLIRPNAEDKAAVVDVDEVVGTPEPAE